MTWTLMCASVFLVAGAAENVEASLVADELEKSEPTIEKPVAAETEESEEEAEAAEPTKKKATKEAAEAEPETAVEPDRKETGDWAEGKRWQRYNERAKGHRHTHPRKNDAVPTDGSAEPSAADDANPWIGAVRPGLLRPRQPLIGLALGGLVGFGTGHLYAGATKTGLIFAGIDVALIAGFIGATVALNDLVVEHDLRSGRSLANGDREFGKREGNYYTLSIVLALAEFGSRTFQAVGGFQASERTNEVIGSFSFVPTGNGALMRVTW